MYTDSHPQPPAASIEPFVDRSSNVSSQVVAALEQEAPREVVDERWDWEEREHEGDTTWDRQAQLDTTWDRQAQLPHAATERLKRPRNKVERARPTHEERTAWERRAWLKAWLQPDISLARECSSRPKKRKFDDESTVFSASNASSSCPKFDIYFRLQNAAERRHRRQRIRSRSMHWEQQAGLKNFSADDKLDGYIESETIQRNDRVLNNQRVFDGEERNRRGQRPDFMHRGQHCTQELDECDLMNEQLAFEALQHDGHAEDSMQPLVREHKRLENMKPSHSTIDAKGTIPESMKPLGHPLPPMRKAKKLGNAKHAPFVGEGKSDAASA
eukprot:CAMPEP_0184494036 /NCGR_PEP_ID=MMETSP0113_2-20130426/27657_1 /TAXON_ID=91329 /ORGANISM="Norrisiella sphaerica, Strain BC52" /LENGTH=328 /DNA_ID=CAMNT_0026879591 /DNA_START=219 /DNA_END=1206 /DNA_ORIENTATION=-